MPYYDKAKLTQYVSHEIMGYKRTVPFPAHAKYASQLITQLPLPWEIFRNGQNFTVTIDHVTITNPDLSLAICLCLYKFHTGHDFPTE